MAQTNTFSTRIQHKHDVEANWLKATTFAPKAGELIIYDVDATHSSPRFKVGDGTTLVTDLPFSSAQSSEVGNALLKTGDTMEGVLKFTPDVHYGASLPETGETGQIYFVEAEEAFLENKDGVVQTNNVNNKAITRAKLANDALYSPVTSTQSRAITVADIGYTIHNNWNVEANFTLTAENSAKIPKGAEIAFMRWGGTADVFIVATGVQLSIAGNTASLAGGTIKIPETFGMIALKKISTGNSAGDNWLVTGNVEVVS